MERKNAQGQRVETRMGEGRHVKDNGSRERSEDFCKQVDYDITDMSPDLCGVHPGPTYPQIETSCLGPDEDSRSPSCKASAELESSAYVDSEEFSQKCAGIRLGIRDGEAGDTYKHQPVIVEKEDGELKIKESKGKIYYVVPAKTVLVESDCIDSALHTCFSFRPKPIFDGDYHKYKASVETPARLIKQGNTYSLLSAGGMGVISLERIK